MRNDFSRSHVIISSITVQHFILPHDSWGRSPNAYIGVTRPFPVGEGAARARPGTLTAHVCIFTYQPFEYFMYDGFLGEYLTALQKS